MSEFSEFIIIPVNSIEMGENITISKQLFLPDFDLDRPIWARNAHIQTAGRVFLFKKPKLKYERKRLNTPDSDFVDIDIIKGKQDKPVLVLFHGLEGSSQSSYALHTMERVKELGWEGVVFNFRSCSGEPNKTIGSYHSGVISELEWFFEYIGNIYPGRTIYTVGFSLGGNVLARWMGEKGQTVPKFIKGAVTVGSPYDLLNSARALDTGINRGYVWWFLRTLKKKAEYKNKLFPGVIDIDTVRKSKTFHEYDGAVIAPIYGFQDAEDYYRKVRSLDVLHNIQVPTLLFNSKDDPFLPSQFLPTKDSLKGSNVDTLYPRFGGHLGFISRNKPDFMVNNIFNWFISLQ